MTLTMQATTWSKNEDFGGNSATPAYNYAGNLVEDASYRYTYDAWNRLVKVQAKEDSATVTIQTAEFDGLGRRIKKVVTNSGENNKTEVYLYDGQRVSEIRNGSGTMVQQFIHGTQYIDELVMVRVKDKGDLYVHQDANWNFIGTTDLGRHLVEREVYSPYGELTVHQSTGFGDRDGDGDVDSTDSSVGGCSDPPTGACRTIDLNFNGSLDATDQTLFASLPQGLQRTPGRLASAVQQPFAHQGLLFEPEIGSYQNRARQYDPAKRRFAQRDHLLDDGPTIIMPALSKTLQSAIDVSSSFFAIGAEFTDNNGFKTSASPLLKPELSFSMNLFESRDANPVLYVDPSGYLSNLRVNTYACKSTITSVDVCIQKKKCKEQPYNQRNSCIINCNDKWSKDFKACCGELGGCV